MPNLAGQYNFNELCIEAQASAPWVKKVQRLLSLVEGGGSKGTRTYYTGNQVNIYSAVKKLRLMDLDFDDIKHIYNLEQEFFKFPSKIEHIMFSSENCIRLIISLAPDHVLDLHLDQFKNGDKSNFLNLSKEYEKMQEYIRTKTLKIKEISDGVINIINKTGIEGASKVLRGGEKK